MIGLYALTAVISGYVSARIYRHIGGKHWAFNIITTLFIFPAPVFGTWFIINNVAWIEGSTVALKISTIFFVIGIWFVVSVPLTIIGGIGGKMKSSDEILEQDPRIPRINKAIPTTSLFRSPIF